MILEQVIRTTASRVAGLPDVEEVGPERKSRRSLDAALTRKEGRNAIIAEIKFASPTKGHIREMTDPVRLGCGFVSAGCVALSVLTEPVFFRGRPEFITAIRPQIQVPILRKDFIIDERQLAESMALGADAVLLIAAVLGDRLPEMVESARAFGLDPLVEVHNTKEVKAALATATTVVGINNRDLTTLSIDLSTTLRLAPMIADAGVKVLSESGFLWPCDIRHLRSSVDGYLIGSAIMSAKQPAKRLEGFVFA
jgi:indole-3-glycerol phosphate synthase